MEETTEIFVRSRIVKVATDISGKIIFADDEFLTIIGYSLDELEGMLSSEILSSCAMGGLCQDAISRVVTDKVWTGNVPFKSKEGKIVWLFGTIFPKYLPDGRIREVAGEFIMCNTRESLIAEKEIHEKYGVDCE